MKKSEYALISEQALCRKVEFAYRDKNVNKDSGWRFYYSIHDYKGNPPMQQIKKRDIINNFPEVREILDSGRGSIFRLLPKGWRKISKDNTLSQLSQL